ncbi:MAG: hypothetical protein FWG34_01565 [Oscillospiraceae bacterium]|nr:hypothetical protein [Oscillospiraceae bacterium]
MIKCMNPECVNYKQELVDGTEICPLCNKPTENIVTSLDKRRPAAAVISLASVGSILFTLLPFYAALYIGLGLLALCVIGSFVIRMVPAIVTSLLCVLAMIGMFYYYGILG